MNSDDKAEHAPSFGQMGEGDGKLTQIRDADRSNPQSWLDGQHLPLAKLIQLEWKRAIALALPFFLITLLFALHRYFTFYASYDQGIFNQILWNALHGRPFQSSLSSVLSGAVVHDGQVPTVFYSRLGQHFDPVLLLWLPLYALAPNPATLVVLHVAVITAGGLVLYGLARQSLKPAIASLVLAGYYGANAIIGPTFSNFHDLFQIPLFLFTLLLAVERRWWWLVALMSVLTLLLRQDAGIVLFGVGLYLIASRRYPKVGLAICIASFSYIIVATNVFMPLFSRDISQRFMMERFSQFAVGEEASTLEILGSIVIHPGRLLSQLLLYKPLTKIGYLLIQALPLLLVPLIAPWAWVIAGFPLLQLFLQQGATPLAIHIRYAITIVPGFFYGAILWWSGRQHLLRPRLKQIWLGCIILSILIALLHSPHRVFYFALPDSYQPWVQVPLTRQWQHSRQLQALIDQVPPDASVTATTYIVPHVSSRREVLRMPLLQVVNDARQVVNVDYILTDLWQLKQYAPAFRSDREQLQATIPLIDQLLAQKQYGIQAIADGVVLLRKGAVTDPEQLQHWQQLKQEYQ